jgi:hypothetical protein
MVIFEETLKFGSIFGNLPPRFSLTSPLSQEREVKSPCFYYVWWAWLATIAKKLPTSPGLVSPVANVSLISQVIATASIIIIIIIVIK